MLSTAKYENDLFIETSHEFIHAFCLSKVQFSQSGLLKKG